MSDAEVQRLLAERTELIEQMKRIEKRIWTINLKLAERKELIHYD
jgi:hypothetical protein